MTTVRRVRRIIRKIDPWTVFKVSVIFWLVAGLGLVLGLVMMWSVLNAAGIPQAITDVLIEITLLEEGSNPFGNDEQFLRLAVFGSLVWSVLGTGFTTLAAVMYNLVSDVVGGIEVVVLEETLAAPAPVRPPPPPPSSNVDLPTEETPVTARR